MEPSAAEAPLCRGPRRSQGSHPRRAWPPLSLGTVECPSRKRVIRAGARGSSVVPGARPPGGNDMITRRQFLAQGVSVPAAAVLGAAFLEPRRAVAQTPRRGGTLVLRLWDPPHWDPY